MSKPSGWHGCSHPCSFNVSRRCDGKGHSDAAAVAMVTLCTYSVLHVPVTMMSGAAHAGKLEDTHEASILGLLEAHAGKLEDTHEASILGLLELP
ncbi:unnamed protein product [Rangifer tarandus platyrhynchus]|uniref:Uncharacterized protein n=1 Tax=Rangifer tarandus platyrhynchus TaxID=3082113 RepID=A0ABN8XRW3_RANTA|nr:unnamed protein product [Rangifer tarandus platyrhynchus]